MKIGFISVFYILFSVICLFSCMFLSSSSSLGRRKVKKTKVRDSINSQPEYTHFDRLNSLNKDIIKLGEKAENIRRKIYNQESEGGEKVKVLRNDFEKVKSNHLEILTKLLKGKIQKAKSSNTKKNKRREISKKSSK